MNKDMDIYFGTDEHYEYKDVPEVVRDRVDDLLEPYRIKIEEEKGD